MSINFISYKAQTISLGQMPQCDRGVNFPDGYKKVIPDAKPIMLTNNKIIFPIQNPGLLYL
ncbi:MAG TPA: hypothetical protein DEB71_00435 [Chryseobacterium carnipullorum]|nr:hypothetical protein [Chryseobacterium carnipullorum]